MGKKSKAKLSRLASASAVIRAPHIPLIHETRFPTESPVDIFPKIFFTSASVSLFPIDKKQYEEIVSFLKSHVF